MNTITKNKHTHTSTKNGAVGSCRNLRWEVIVLPQPGAAVQLVERGRQTCKRWGRRGVGGGIRVLPGHGRPGGGG